MKLWLFLVEGNSDKIYVDKIIKYYVKSEKLKKEIKLEWIILDGKYNYDKKEKQIKQKINKFKNQNKNSDYEIIYVIDLDKFKREEKDRIFLENIKKFIQMKILKEVRLMEATAIKKVVAMGIGPAIYIVLSRFVVIPTPIPNTTLQVTFAFVALMAFIYGPAVGLGIRFVGHTLNDISRYGSVWFSWVAAAAFFGLATGFSGKIVKIENFNGAKIVKFIVWTFRQNCKS